MADVFGLDADGVDKLRRAIRATEGSDTSGFRGKGTPRSAFVDVVEITSTTKSGGYYPAKKVIYNDADSTWLDRDVLWAMDLNGADLEATKYPGRCIGSVNGRPLYALQSNSPSPSLAVVLDIVSQVCPVFDVVSGYTVVTGLTVETTPTTLPGGSSKDTPVCVDDSEQCCGPACGACDAVAAKFHVTVAGVTDGTCTDCDTNVNTTFDLINTVGTCTWELQDSHTVCSGDALNVILTFDSGSSTWKLTFDDAGSIMVTYSLASASFDCVTSNVLTKGSNDGKCATWPATLTVVPFI